MSITATLFDFIGIKPHSSFLGKSILSESPRNYVIAESCGSGFADGLKADLFFTVVTEHYRMMTTLKGRTLFVKHLYSRKKDPKEIYDIVYIPENKGVIESLINFLYTSRKDVLEMRGVVMNSWSYVE